MDVDSDNISNISRKSSGNSSKRRPRISIGEHAAQMLNPTSLGRVSSSRPHRFLSISSKQKEKALGSHRERQITRKVARNARNERRNSILKSLAVLDIEDGDEDYQVPSTSQQQGEQQSSVDSSSNHSQRRYMRRGSVTRHKIEADLIGMQPSEKACDRGDESDYGSNYDSEYEQEKERKRYLRRGSVTKYSLDYASVGADMQPENVATSNEKMFKRGGVVVDKERLPPPPSNDSFRLDDDTDILGTTSESQSCHTGHSHTATRHIRSKSGRPSRRGSMKMPMRDDPRPGDDYWSGNINDSGHQRRDMYFDSPEDILSPKLTPSKSMGSNCENVTSSSSHSIALAPLSSTGFHPITVHKPRSGRRICVDEAELYTSYEEKKHDDLRETILPANANQNFGQKPKFDRNDSGFSYESDESSVASFGAESVEESVTAKIHAVPSARTPRLPPSYSMASKAALVSDTCSVKKAPPGSRTDRAPISLVKKTSGALSSSSEDSTVSSNSTEEGIYPLSVMPPSTIPSNVIASLSEKGISDGKHSMTARKKVSTNIDPMGKISVGLATDRKPSAVPHQKKVHFNRIVITEFPIILGDNPAVTSGAPITIDWHPQGERVYSVDSYEECKPARRRRRKLLISVSHRAILLLAAGYSIDDIADASINAQQIKFSRQESMNASQYRERVSLLMENTNDAFNGIVHNTGRKLKALITKPVQHSETARTA
ncbi:hypothetical protein IV203_027899 [Nitzschia inconspicua]|uniref:Uncharacterized protein n=1 Tax=Nitzschia inconspicua TaxID=303405 RepID=A0A9K3Q3V8_9STRA|nr:hypothetical protein IV203_027899 [Nitzschia inconspicua]